MPDDRLPTPEQIQNLQQPIPPGTCVLCWKPAHPLNPVDNGVCGVCRADLDKRVVQLVAENARLRQEVEELRAAAKSAHTLIRDEGGAISDAEWVLKQALGLMPDA
jgi:hypothetical protein